MTDSIEETDERRFVSDSEPWPRGRRRSDVFGKSWLFCAICRKHVFSANYVSANCESANCTSANCYPPKQNSSFINFNQGQSKVINITLDCPWLQYILFKANILWFKKTKFYFNKIIRTKCQFFTKIFWKNCFAQRSIHFYGTLILNVICILKVQFLLKANFCIKLGM